MSDPEQSTPGLPGYQAAAPGGGYESIPLPPPSRLKSVAESPIVGIFPLAFGIVGLFFNLFGLIAIFLGIAVFRSTGPIGKIMAVVGILFALTGLIWSIVDVVRTHEIISLIF